LLSFQICISTTPSALLQTLHIVNDRLLERRVPLEPQSDRLAVVEPRRPRAQDRRDGGILLLPEQRELVLPADFRQRVHHLLDGDADPRHVDVADVAREGVRG